MRRDEEEVNRDRKVGNGGTSNLSTWLRTLCMPFRPHYSYAEGGAAND
jgi:hypothetical protein